jgi:hypothetical protein
MSWYVATLLSLGLDKAQQMADGCIIQQVTPVTTLCLWTVNAMLEWQIYDSFCGFYLITNIHIIARLEISGIASQFAT